MGADATEKRPSLKGKRLSFLGGGNMAEALIRGVLEANLVEPSQITVSDVVEERLRHLEGKYGVSTLRRNDEAARGRDIVILAVKPQSVREVLEEIRGVVGSSTLVISIAAGFPLSAMQEGLARGMKLIRVMPNTGALVLEGAAALCATREVTPEEMAMARRLFEAVGRAMVVGEELMDAATGLCGSGPAYVFIFIEALADAGVKQGLSREAALTLSAQTVLGAAKMVLELGRHPAQLKDMVTSPGGTTAAGIHALEQGGFRAAAMNAVEAATRRSRELGAR